MIRATALLNNFVMTAVAASFLCWLATLHPSLLLFVQALFTLKLIISVAAWVLDDAIVAILKVDLLQLRFRLIASTVGILVGVGVMLCRS